MIVSDDGKMIIVRVKDGDLVNTLEATFDHSDIKAFYRPSNYLLPSLSTKTCMLITPKETSRSITRLQFPSCRS
jgi:hypothetical protein